MNSHVSNQILKQKKNSEIIVKFSENADISRKNIRLVRYMLEFVHMNSSFNHHFNQILRKNHRTIIYIGPRKQKYQEDISSHHSMMFFRSTISINVRQSRRRQNKTPQSSDFFLAWHDPRCCANLAQFNEYFNNSHNTKYFWPKSIQHTE